VGWLPRGFQAASPGNYILAVDLAALVDFALVVFALVAFAGASAANDTEPRTRPRPRAMVIIFFMLVKSP